MTSGSPRRFDIAVFSAGRSRAFNMKRIIGLPGETVQIRENRVIYINGEPLEAEDGAGRGLHRRAGGISHGACAEDEYFLLGDNRESSEDSRFPSIGNVKRDQLIGEGMVQDLSRFPSSGPVSQ